ncbi:transposase family protein [Actinosynnema sp. NPDC047251]|nr:transposase family protein [Saccharothrix espanaensis]
MIECRVISESRSEWIAPFTGLQPGQFRKLVRVVAARGGDTIEDGRPGRQWRLDLADRVLLVATYWRTNLTMRQLGPLLGVSHAAANRVVDTVGPLPTLAPVKRRRIDQVAIVDGTRLVIATGDPKPGNRNDRTVYRDSGIADILEGRPVMADGGHQGNPEVITPYRKPRDGSPLADWQKDPNTVHRSIRTRAEHALAHMKNRTILRDYRRAAHTLRDTTSGIAHLHNLTG